MNDIERRLHEHLHSIDEARVHDADAVSAATDHHRRRLDRRRRMSAVVGAVAVVAVGGVAVWAVGRDDSGPTTAPSSAPSTAPGPTVATTVPPSTSVPPATTTTIAPSPVGSWKPIAPDPRGPTTYPAVVWTGSEALVLGGTALDGTVRAGFVAYEPADDAWRALAGFPGGWQRIDPLVVWTGSQMLVVGGTNADGSVLVSDAHAYDPDTDRWTTLTSPPVGFVTERSPFVWTGTALLVWPGDGGGSSMPITPIVFTPATGEWTELPAPPVGRRQSAASVWTGAEWIVWGGTDGTTELADGAAFDPSSSTWRTLAESPLSRRRVRAVWTGSEMIVAAGSSGGDRQTGNSEFALADGAAYDPATDSWRSIADGFAHPGFIPVWTGTSMVLFAKGGALAYDVAADRWIDTCCDGLGAFGPPVWIGDVALVIGSGEASIGGGLFTPPVVT